MFAISFRPFSPIIDVSFVAEIPEDARIIVDEVLDQYLRYTGEMSNDTEEGLYQQLVEQYNALQTEIAGREAVISGLRRSLGTANPQELLSSKRSRLEQTQVDLNRLKKNIALLELQEQQGLKTMVVDSNNGLFVAVSEQEEPKKPEYFEDAEWRSLDNNVRTLKHNIENSDLTSKHPDAIKAAKNLEFAEELLRRREEQLDEQWNSNMERLTEISNNTVDISNVENRTISVELQLEQAKLEEQFLLAELENQQKDFNDLFVRAQLFEQENSELQNKRNLFNAVRERRTQKEIERDVPGTIEVLMGAFVSSSPYNDRRIVFTAMALCMSLGMAGGIVYLRAVKNQAIYTSKELQKPIQMPFLGSLPVTKLMGILNLDEEVSPVMTESIRVVRTALLSRLNGQKFNTLLITSATPGTGKTTFTMMLGKSLIQTGKKILIIDSDLKKMSLTQQFIDLPNDPGFIKALRNPSEYKKNTFQVYNMNLDIMPAGKSSDDDTIPEEIANGAFKVLMKKLRSRYDIILIDGSPILPVADSVILSSQVDGTIFVEREHVSNRTNIMNAIDRVNSANGKMLGFVFVGSESYASYNYYYGNNKKT